MKAKILSISIVLLVGMTLIVTSCRTSAPHSTAAPAPVAFSGWGGSWAPDYKKFVTSKPRGKGLELCDPQSGQRTLLLPVGKDPVWSPDGRQIVFVKEPSFNQYTAEEVWVVQVDGTQERRLAQGGFPRWSPDSKTVYFHCRSDNSVRAIAVEAVEPQPELFFAKSLSWYPAVYPDGKAIAFGSGGKLMVVERATRKTLLTWNTPGERGLLPGWSPDGRYLAFGGFDDSKLGLWCLDLQTSNAVQLAEGPFTLPAWSPDGKRLSFDYRGKVWETWVVSQKWLKLRMQNKVPVLQHKEIQPPAA